MLITLSYCRNDEDLAFRLVEWMGELGPYKGHEFLLVNDSMCMRVAAVNAQAAKAGFDKVHNLLVSDDADKKWPQSPNLCFRRTAKHIQFTMMQPWLWLEPDALPVRKGWLDDLEKEYKSLPPDKFFLGAYVSKPGIVPHMSGVGVYPGMITSHAGTMLLANDAAFDVVGADQVLPKMERSQLITHQWKREPYTSWEEFEGEVLKAQPLCAIYHQDKTGALYPILREQLFPQTNQNDQNEKEHTANGVHRDGSNRNNPTDYGSSGGSMAPSVGSGGARMDLGRDGLICDILIKTYPQDYPWLTYCTLSIAKFATGFRNLIVLYPEGEELPVIDEGGMRLKVVMIPVAENGEGYLFQQTVKMQAHKFSDADYILHMDSDCVLTEPITPDKFMKEYFEHNLGDVFSQKPLSYKKPIWTITPYENTDTPWKPITEKFMGEPVEYEFMRRFPFLIPRSLHVAAEKFCQLKHGVSVHDYIMSQPNRDFSEFNALGALAYARAWNQFHWVDSTKEELPPVSLIQSFSHGGLTAELREKFENILSGGVESRHAGSGGEADTSRVLTPIANPSGSSAPPAQNSKEERASLVHDTVKILAQLATAPRYKSQVRKELQRQGIVK